MDAQQRSSRRLLFDTAIGWCGLAWSERGVMRLQLPEANRAATEARLRGAARGECQVSGAKDQVLNTGEDSGPGAPPHLPLATCHLKPGADAPPEIGTLIAELQRYFRGERVEFTDVCLDLSRVSPFDRQVYQAARTLGWGETATYGELARKIGAPDAARAVGGALGRNPVTVIVPCHRILAHGQRIGGFSAYGGVSTKERLLALEGVRPGVPRGGQTELSFHEEARTASPDRG